MRSLEEIKKDNFMYQIEKMILLLHIDCDIVASPWDYEKTVEEMCITNTDDNNLLYERIKQKLKERLMQTFPYIEDITLEKLMKGVVADWILRCPINFE